jgi:CheY-specific phosphatase CheX
MAETVDYKSLAARYGLAPTPESVSRLTRIVASQDCDVNEIADVIDKDRSLRARLLGVANPHATSEADYTIDTVEDALMRNGMGCALLLAMGTPLALALTKTFQTMLSQKLEQVEVRGALPLQGEHLLGMIGFAGKAVGRVDLRMSLESAREIAATILGLAPEELKDTDEIRDAAGELLNIMTGNFKSNLCDAGLTCRLEPPTVKRTSNLETPTIPGGGLERMAFRAGRIQLFVTVTVNPFNGD